MEEPFRAPDPSTELGAAFELRWRAPTKPTPSRRFVPPGRRGRGQAGCLVRDGRRYGGRADDPDLHRGAVPRARARGRGVRRGAGRSGTAGGRRWIIDPIDGTHSYMRGVPLFATLLAFEAEGRLAVSTSQHRRCTGAGSPGGRRRVVDGHEPRRHRLPSATRLHVSGVANLEDAHLVLSSWLSLRDSDHARLRRAGRASLEGTRLRRLLGLRPRGRRGCRAHARERPGSGTSRRLASSSRRRAGGSPTSRVVRTCPRKASWRRTASSTTTPCASCAEEPRREHDGPLCYPPGR